MIKRDEAFRKELNANVKKEGQRINAPTSIQLPSSTMTSWQESAGSVMTPRAYGNSNPMTPGMGIGVATPAPLNHLQGVPEDGTSLDKQASWVSRASAEKPGDYFSSTPITAEPTTKPAATASEPQDAKASKPPPDAEKESTNGKDSRLGKKFRMGMSFGSKKLGRSASTNIEKPVIVDEKVVEDGSETSENGEKEKEVDDSLFGIVQKIRNEYEKALLENPDQQVESGITPSLSNETPVLKPPPFTTVIIQEETSGGSADLYRGTVATVGEDASLIEERAPMWLGDLLLRVCSFYRQYLLKESTNKRVEQDSPQGTCQGVFHTPAMARHFAKYRRPRW
jgi:WD repeat-containing protein 48